MFAKLFKYEFRNTKKLALPLIMAVLLAGILAAMAIFLNCYTSGRLQEGDYSVQAMLSSINNILIFLFVFVVAISLAAMVIILLLRYYNSTAKDEAYLTFTLPVSSDQIIMSKFFNTILWLVLLFISLVIVGILCWFSAALGFYLFNDVAFSSFWENSAETVESVFSLFGLEANSYLVAVILQILLRPIELILVFFAVTGIAAMLVKKHKVFMIVLLLFVVNFVHSGISTICDLLFIKSSDWLVTATVSEYIKLIVSVLIATGEYFMTKHIMDKKLNVE